MLKTLSKLIPGRKQRAAANLYDSVMKHSLSRGLYASGMTSDTFDGRFEAVTLFSCLIMRRLRDFGETGEQLADEFYKEVFRGFDHALRERGAGDSSIARKIRGYGERFFGLSRAVDAAMLSEKKAFELKSVLKRNDVGGGKTEELVEHLIKSEELLTFLEYSAFKTGTISWPDA